MEICWIWLRPKKLHVFNHQIASNYRTSYRATILLDHIKFLDNDSKYLIVIHDEIPCSSSEIEPAWIKWTHFDILFANCLFSHFIFLWIQDANEWFCLKLISFSSWKKTLALDSNSQVKNEVDLKFFRILNHQRGHFSVHFFHFVLTYCASGLASFLEANQNAAKHIVFHASASRHPSGLLFWKFNSFF